jgi:hypothetical protein
LYPPPPSARDFTQNIQTKGLNCKILQNKDLSAREHLKTSLGQLRGPAWFGERTHSCPNSILVGIRLTQVSPICSVWGWWKSIHVI